MTVSAALDAVIQSRAFDYLCTPVTCLPDWASDGTLVRLALVGAAGWIIGRALANQHLPMQGDLQRAVDQTLRHGGMVAEAYLARGSRRLAAGCAGCLDAFGLSCTAARVRMVNGLT